MKNFSLYTEELDFNNKEGKNITVGKYETEYFTLCPGAVDAFTNLMKESGVDMAKVEEAAKTTTNQLKIREKIKEEYLIKKANKPLKNNRYL